MKNKLFLGSALTLGLLLMASNNFVWNGIVSDTGLPLPGTKVNAPNPPNVPANEQVTATEFNTVTGALSDIAWCIQDGGVGGGGGYFKNLGVGDGTDAGGITSDGGPLVIWNPVETSTGPCTNKANCPSNQRYSYYGNTVYLQNDLPQVTLCNTQTGNPDDLMADAGLCFNMYGRNDGWVEFNNIAYDATAASTSCGMNIITGDFECDRQISASYLSGPEFDIAPSAETFGFADDGGFTIKENPDPLQDAGGLPLVALYVFNQLGNNGYKRNLYFSDEAFDTNSGFNVIDFRAVNTFSGIPPMRGTVIVDAGQVNNWTVNGTLLTNSPALLNDGAIVDGGISAGGINNGAAWCLGQDSLAPQNGDLSFGGCSGPYAQANNKILMSDGQNTTFYADGGITLTAAQGPITLTANAAGVPLLQVGYINSQYKAYAYGLQVGSSLANSTYFSHIASGTCTLSSGTCNAVVAGNTGNSLCYCGIQGTYARDAGAVTCSAQADAGSATCYCYYATLVADPAPAPVGIHCDN